MDLLGGVVIVLVIVLARGIVRVRVLVLVFGLGVTIIAGLSVWLQVAVVLFGPKHWRSDLMTLEWPENIGGRVEGKERLELETLVDQVEERARLRREKEAAAQTAGG